MQIWFIISIVFSLIVAIFAALNSDIVLIKFFGYNYEMAQSVVILVSAGLGAAIATFLGLFGRIKSGLKNRDVANKLKDAEKRVEELDAKVKDCEMREMMGTVEHLTIKNSDSVDQLNASAVDATKKNN